MATILEAAGGVVTNEAGEVLWIFRRGFWDLPKGKLDAGETLEQCALREVQEETGVAPLTIQKKIGTTTHRYFDTYLQQEVDKITHWYAMHCTGSPALIPQTEEDITDIIWANATQQQQCLENTFANIRQIIDEWHTHSNT
ncbi:MAG: NUDIX domain-containing protein [Bacteroidetes bacterium]|nr:MAG: NUDIX domain-containing protein [Bacteroidota bacterium]TAF98036.1 MAG: NUDIX domain-containing protein [Bacteroidota bacterium]